MRNVIAVLLACAGTAALAQDAGVPGQKKPEFQIAGNINKPTQLPPDLATLKVPAGYEIAIAATDLGNARMIAAAEDGTVYVTRRNEADVLMLKDADRDGRYETKRVAVARAGMHGIAIDGRTAFFVTHNEVLSAPILADGGFGPLATIVDDLPDTGQHANRTIAIGPDGMLYVSVGSTCNACTESTQESATLLRLSRDGKQRKIYASGLRNTIGFDWNPADGQLWGLDQGIDWLGDEAQPEELNRIEEGKRYGWPYIYADGRRNPQDVPPNGLTMDDWDRMSRRMVAGYTAHAAAMQLRFAHAAAFPADAQKDAFATFRGSWNRAEPSGYEVVRIRFAPDGTPAFEPFLTGFLATAPGGEAGWTGRPTGLAFAPDGSMLVTDSENGVLYRIRYTGTDAARPIAATKRPVAPPPTDRIAFLRPETAGKGTLTVSSPAFRAGGAIPPIHSAWNENVSPPLAWTAGPAETRSYVVIVDDPDADSQKPVTHWVAWNVPATTTALPAGLAGTVQLAEPKAMRQGAATPGITGWYGMRPPVGDRPHRYHFQVFALDSELATLPGADRIALLEDVAGHVLARGELVGTYAQPQPPRKK